MPSIDLNQQRKFAYEVVAQLRQAGFESLWAGGCVRDQLLGQTPKDYDIATSATPQEVRQLFGMRRTIPVGVAFGVVTVLGPKQAGQIEVATFRTEGGYSDGRRPDQVEFATAELDASRRDFTINGLFYDPIEEQVLDYVGGQNDLQAGVLRAIGDAQLRLAEDKLRMLRAVRFASRFDFAIEPATLQAVREQSAEIAQVSGERIGAEMRSMLVHPNRRNAIERLVATNLAPHVFPEFAQITADEQAERLALANRLQTPSFGLVLAALLSPHHSAQAAPATARKKKGEASSLGRRWKLPNRDVDHANWLIDHLPLACKASETAWPVLQRVLIQEGAEELIDLAEAVAGPDADSVCYCREKLALPPAELNPRPLLTGSDLIAQGFKPGPHFKALLDHLRDAQLEGTLTTREQALQQATEWGVGHRRD